MPQQVGSSTSVQASIPDFRLTNSDPPTRSWLFAASYELSATPTPCVPEPGLDTCSTSRVSSQYQRLANTLSLGFRTSSCPEILPALSEPEAQYAIQTRVVYGVSGQIIFSPTDLSEIAAFFPKSATPNKNYILMEPAIFDESVRISFQNTVAENCVKHLAKHNPNVSCLQEIKIFPFVFCLLFFPLSYIGYLNFRHLLTPHEYNEEILRSSGLSELVFIFNIFIFISLCFRFSVFLRIARDDMLSKAAEQPAFSTPDEPPELPSISLMIPLYDEVNTIQQLCDMLSNLTYPRDLLQIIFILEKQYNKTRAAMLNSTIPSGIEIVTVPPVGPRNKPKALSYVLPLCRGDIVGVFDAEDVASSHQLLEIASLFSRAPQEVGAIQCTLAINGSHGNWIKDLFAMEYSAHFNGVLAALDRWSFPIPLCGSSNYIRRDVLEHVGGWDPYNLAEDADLGLRLERYGYKIWRCPSITWEEAGHPQ